MMITRGADDVIRRWDAGNGKELGQSPSQADTNAASPRWQNRRLPNADGTIRLHAVVDAKNCTASKGHANGQASRLLARQQDLARRASAMNDPVVRRRQGIDSSISSSRSKRRPWQAAARRRYPATGQGIAFSPTAKRSQPINAPQPRPDPPRLGRGQRPDQPGKLVLWDVATAGDPSGSPLPVPAHRQYARLLSRGRLIATDKADQTVSLVEIAAARKRALLGQPDTGVPTQPLGPVVNFVGGRGQATGIMNTPLAFSRDRQLLASRGPTGPSASGKRLRKESAVPRPCRRRQRRRFSAYGKALAVASSTPPRSLGRGPRFKRETTPTGSRGGGRRQIELLWRPLSAMTPRKAAPQASRALASAPQTGRADVARGRLQAGAAG